MSASLIKDRCDSGPLTLGEHIMLVTLEWLFDISLAVTSAAATGSIFLLLLELGKVARKHFVHNTSEPGWPKWHTSQVAASCSTKHLARS
jgi:hypothetical protein